MLIGKRTCIGCQILVCCTKTEPSSADADPKALLNWFKRLFCTFAEILAVSVKPSIGVMLAYHFPLNKSVYSC